MYFVHLWMLPRAGMLAYGCLSSRGCWLAGRQAGRGGGAEVPILATGAAAAAVAQRLSGSSASYSGTRPTLCLSPDLIVIA